MAPTPNQNTGSTASVLGMLTALLVGEVGAALAVIGGLWTAFTCLNQIKVIPRDQQWLYYLIAGVLFVAILAICRWTRRS